MKKIAMTLVGLGAWMMAIAGPCDVHAEERRPWVKAGGGIYNMLIDNPATVGQYDSFQGMGASLTGLINRYLSRSGDGVSNEKQPRY